jgi:hypothetical protein
MSTNATAFQFALAASIGFATLASNSCRAQSLTDKIDFQKIDGPYSYKSPTDLIAIVGFVTEVKGPDVVFRDCSGKTKTVKRNELTRIQRNCPPGSPVGPWILDAAGKIIPLINYPIDAKVYLGMEKTQIDPDSLPAEFRQHLKAAKPGDWVALSYPSDSGKLNLSFIGRTEPQ